MHFSTLSFYASAGHAQQRLLFFHYAPMSVLCHRGLICMVVGRASSLLPS